MHRFFPLAAGLFALSFTLQPAAAQAQACCGAAQGVGLGRLAMGQAYLVGVDAQYVEYFGRYDRQQYVSLAHDTREFRQTLFATARLFEDFQFALSVPFVQTHKDFGELTEFGGGMGDISASLRYEYFAVGERRNIPGMAMLLTGKLPTGRSVYESLSRRETLLQTDTTGTGSYDLGFVFQLENTHGSLFWSLQGGAQYAFPFVNAQHRTITRNLRWDAAAAIGYAAHAPIFADESLYLSLGLASDFTTGHEENHQFIDGSQERRTVLTLQAGAYILPQWFVAARVGSDIPASHFGENLLTGTQIGLTLRRVSYDWL